MGRTTELRRSLKERFISSAADRGFAIDARHQPISTVFRRRAGGRVEFERYWQTGDAGPHLQFFRLNAGGRG